MEIILFAILILNYSVIELPFNLSILQLEGYNFLQYVHTKYKNNKVFCAKLLLDIVLFALAIFKIHHWIISLVYILAYMLFSAFYIYKRKLKIKRYISTKRIFRFHLIFILLSLLSITIKIVSITRNLIPFMFKYVTISTYILYIASYLINLIFECILLGFYIKKAKRKIKDNNVKIIAITGSYAKTSVKHILYQLLIQKYNVVRSPKSYNTPSGICKTINQADLKNVDYLILEYGAKKRGEIKRLCKLFPPSFGILTGIAEQHLRDFKSIDNIIKTKCELQQSLVNEKFMVFNTYNSYVANASLDFSGGMYLVGEGGNFYVSEYRANFDSTSYKICFGKDEISVESYLLGFHNAINVCLSVAMAYRLGVSENLIKKGLSYVVPIDSRLYPTRLNNNVLVLNNGYNSNPFSAKCSLDVLSEYVGFKKVVITPGFVEMGKKQFQLNYVFGKQIAGIADEVVIVKEVNKSALLKGIMDSGFDMARVSFASRFKDIDLKKYSDSVILIENDLPDNYQ